MAFLLLRLLAVAVIAAAADDVQNVTWSLSPRASLACVAADARRHQRRPPPPLEPEDRQRTQRYYWRRNNVEINSKRISQDGTLEVYRRQNNSDGVYQCLVWHQGGFVLGYPIHLKFAYMDKQFMEQPANTTATVGQPVVFTCNINSGPRATVTWLRNGELLPDYVSRRSVFLPNQLLIMDVTEEDEGVYWCTATNTMLSKTRTSRPAWLRVENKHSSIPVSFLPVYQEKNIVTSRGSSIKLACPIVGWPMPKINWQKNDDPLDSTSQVLVLRNVERRNQGIYKCKVDDENLEKIFNVTVGEPVNITIPPTPKEVIRATTVRFNCTAVGHPKPTITWYRNGKPLLMGGRFNQRPSPTAENRVELVVGGVTSEDAGIYQCFASNAISIASSWAMLRVTGEGASPPGDVQCWPTGARSVLVRWSRPDAYNIVAYTVQTSVSAGTSSSPGQPHTNTKEEISLPQPLTPYTFQVRAVIQTITKKNVASDMSERVVCQGQGVPIQMTRPSDYEVLVSWKEFAKESPGVVQWMLQHKVLNGTGEEHNVTLDGDVTSYTLTVPKSQVLLVRVLGSRSRDWLAQNLTLVPWSSTKSLDNGISSAVPVSVRVTHVDAQEFTVSWRCEAQDQVDGYIVCASNDDGFKKCAETNRQWITLENLEPSTEYEVTVQAHVPGHQFESSLPIHVTTHPLVSGRFKEVSCKFVNSTALLVSWNADSPKFTVFYANGMYAPMEKWDVVDTRDNSILITDINRSSEIILKVTAYDPVETIEVVDCHAPKIKGLIYTFVPSGIRVSWNGTGTQTVRYSQNLTLSVEQWTSFNVTDNTLLLTNLDPSLPTYVMVKAPDTNQNSQVLTIPVRPIVKTNSSFYVGIGVACGMCVLCVLVVVAVCVWRRRKNARSPHRPRRRNMSPNGADDEEASEMKNIGGGLANGGGSKDAGEPLLNGHVHITENPQSKTPNGKMKKGRVYVDAFDLSRYDDQDATMETVLADTSTSTAYNLLDTSRRPEYDLSLSSRDISANNSYNKLPDDNMNSELTRSTDFESDNSKIQPTLQPNG